MTWKGTARTFSAAVRAAERDARRREAARAISSAAVAVVEWEDHLESLTSVHKNLTDPVDWRGIAEQPRPERPGRQRLCEERAAAALARFKPSFLHMLRGGSEKVRRKLEAELAAAPECDDLIHKEALASYEKALAQWEAETAFAQELLRGEGAALREVLEENQEAWESTIIGTAIEFSIADNFVHARPMLYGPDIVPRFQRRQLASGRLSETRMPVARHNEIYQDHVASVAFKIAGDLFHLLPLDEVFVTCSAKMLNPQSGHLEWTPILSVHFVRETLESLNLHRIDPSESLRNFRHAIKFSKTKGLAAITPLAVAPA